MVTLYTTHCPKCIILEKKLQERNIEYQVCDNVDLMLERGFAEAPMLEIDGEIFNFGESIKKLNNITV